MDARSSKKSMSFPQAVGLLAALADGAGNFSKCMFSKQELWRHVLAAHTSSSLSLVKDETLEPSAPAADSNPAAGAIRVKKVRFAPDVVEPAGDGRAYRGKNGGSILIETQGYAVKQAPRENCHKKRVNLNDEAVRASHANLACKAQSLTKPYLPVNRMLLYKGKQLSRSTMALDFRV